MKIYTKSISSNSPKEDHGYNYEFGLFIVITDEGFHYELYQAGKLIHFKKKPDLN